MTAAPKGPAAAPPSNQKNLSTGEAPDRREQRQAPAVPEGARVPSGGAGTAAGEIWAAIPARYDSERFPGKPLAPIAGKAMIQHVYERAQLAPSVARVVVATDSERIADAVRAFGGEAVMTGPHPTGTDRIAEAIRKASEGGAPPRWVLNVQGDEPLIDPNDLETLAAGMRAAGHGTAEQGVAEPAGDRNRDRQRPDHWVMGTLVYPLGSEAELHDPHVVKAVLDGEGRALYFSRSPLPHPRGAGGLGWRHIGVYLFRTDFLYTFAEMAVTPLARREQLEQLRALENGYPIHCFEAAALGVGVDVPEDIARVEALLATQLTAPPATP